MKQQCDLLFSTLPSGDKVNSEKGVVNDSRLVVNGLFKNVLIIFFLCFQITAPGTAQELVFKIYHIQQISPGSVPKSIIDDQRGFLLVLTDKGLVQFNGITFTPITHAPPLTQLTQTHNGKLLGLAFNGVYQITSTPDTVTFQQVVSCQQPISLFEDSIGGWWIQLSSGPILYYLSGRTIEFTVPHRLESVFFWENAKKELFAFSSAGEIFQPVTGSSAFEKTGSFSQVKGIKILLKKSATAFWLATDSALYEVQAQDAAKSRFVVEKKPIPVNQIHSLFQSDDHYLYISTFQNGLFRASLLQRPYHFEPVLFSNQTTVLETLPLQSVQTFYKGTGSSIWLVSKEGLALLFPKFFFHPYPVLKSYETGSIAQSQRGYYYFSAVNEVVKIDPSAYPAKIEPVTQLPQGSISTIAAEQNRIWIGSSTAQLSYLQDDKWYPGLDLSKRGGPVFNIQADSKRRVWFCQVFREKPLPGISYTDSTLTLSYFGPEQGLPGRIISVKESPEGIIYAGGIGNNTYLYRYNPGKGQFENLSLPLPFDVNHFEIHDLSADRQQNIWLASTHGLLKYDLRKKTITRIELGPYLTITEMRAITIDQQEQIWVSTDSYGLLCYRNGSFVRFTLANGMPGPGNNLWYRRLLIDNQNRIWVGSHVTFAASVLTNPVPASTLQPLFLNLQANGKKINLANHKAVFPHHTQLKATFISMSYPTGTNEYQVRLMGMEKDWNAPSTQQSLTYPLLPTGKYTLQVRARQSGYDWSDTLEFPFSVQAVWYLQWWAYLLYAVAVMALLWGLVRLKTWQHEKENIRLNKIINEKTQALRETHQEVVAQNEELLSQQEEISMQHKKISLQYSELQKAQEIIAEQNQTIQKKNETLEKQVDERTKELVEYSQQLEQFAFITAHNLRSPIARIQGLGTLLELANTQAGIDTKDVTQKLIKTAYDIDQVVKDLNTVLEVKKNSTQVLTKINLYDEIEKVRSNLSKEIEETQAKIQEELTEVSVFQSIQAYIDSILYNLISNSIKYRHPARTPHIVIKTTCTGQTICLEVSDNGLGMDLAAYGKSVFQLYKRFHFHVEGKGLGLYLVKTQVEAMGGRIELESEVNRGTTFRIFLNHGKHS
jgi:signal transduction histidine kinase/ligand-binding sensor domain-containing protein